MEPIKTYSRDFRLRYREVNRYGFIKAVAWFDFMQEAAGDHADALGVGRDYMRENRLFWVLVRLRLAVSGGVEPGETLRLTTWPRGFRRLFAERHFRFTDASGRELAAASSQWMLISQDTMRPVAIERIAGRLPDNSDLPGPFELSGRLPLPETPQLALEYPVRFTQEDINGHLNNGQYANIVQEWAEEFSAAPREIASLEIVYHQAVRAGNLLKVHGEAETANTFRVAGYRESGELSFAARIAMRNSQNVKND